MNAENDTAARLAALERAEREAAEQTYRQAVHATADAHPSDETLRELHRLGRAVGKNGEQIHADISAVQHEAALAAAAAPEQSAKSEEAAAAAEFDAFGFDAKREKLLRTLEAEFQPRRDRLNAARNSLATARQAREQLQEHRAKFWRLLGAEDPAVRGNRRHFCQFVGGPPTGALVGIGVVRIEAIMGSPVAHWGALEKFEPIPLAGQTLAQAQALQQRAVEIVRGGKEAWYLVEDSAAALPAEADRSRLISPREVNDNGLLNSPERFVLMPGQSDKQKNELIEQARGLLKERIASVFRSR